MNELNRLFVAGVIIFIVALVRFISARAPLIPPMIIARRVGSILAMILGVGLCLYALVG